MVRARLEPNNPQRADHTADVNWAPRSEVMVSGTPKRETQTSHRAFAQEEADVPANGTASAQREVLSMIVKIYVLPAEGGRGPTRSRCTCWNRLEGMAKVDGGRCTVQEANFGL